MAKLEIELRTLTPLWTGGVDQTCDRLHETGLIGSLRWWYEALVRGLGGYACDPTNEKTKCKEYDPKKGPQSVCAACYLFGTTGWARLFRMRVIDEGIEQIPLHFYTTLPSNKGWLTRIFNVGSATVPFGKFRLIITTRGVEDDYALKQVAWTLAWVAKFGGIGAKLQHGFGQVSLKTNLKEMIATSEKELKGRLPEFLSSDNDEAWPDRRHFFIKAYRVQGDHSLFREIYSLSNLVGTRPQKATYIPCVFDLRYKGGEIQGKQLGFRQWLIDRDWKRSEISALLGETRARRDEDRAASRLFMGMPWLDGSKRCTIKVFGFVPPGISVERIAKEIDEYIKYLFERRNNA